jgi:ribosomal protein L29
VRRIQPTRKVARVNTLDEMLNLELLTPEQHAQIRRWIARMKTPEAILQMPPGLWQALEHASDQMKVDRDLLRPPSFSV